MRRSVPAFILVLRLFLAATFLYSGWQLMTAPAVWFGFVPDWFQKLLPVPLELYLRVQGAAEWIYTLSFLTGFGIRFTAILAFLELSGILVFYGVDLVTFRDLGIVGGVLALAFYYWNRE